MNNEVDQPDTHRTTETVVAKVCKTCGNELEWRECYNCEDGYSDHDCGEDCCCCLNPEPNVPCDICFGKGGWLQCRACYKGSDWE